MRKTVRWRGFAASFAPTSTTSSPLRRRPSCNGSWAKQFPDFFKAGGLKTFGEFRESISRYGDWRSVSTDVGLGLRLRARDGAFSAGAGCPRSARLRHRRLERSAGVANICRGDNLWRLRHRRQTHYPAGHFDLIIAYSVFTHLAGDAQQAWLGEMRRIIAPGGLFLASVHGSFSASFADRGNFLKSQLPPGGLFDATLDAALDGIAPEGYYREVFQTREYTVRKFGRPPRSCIDHLERGMGNHQDLVVMRRRPDAALT